MLGTTSRELVLEAIEPTWNRGYGRCLDHLRLLMPKLLPALQNQRFVFMAAYVRAVLSARARTAIDLKCDRSMWFDSYAVEHFAQTVVALLEAPLELCVEALAEIGRQQPLEEQRGPLG